MFGEDLSFSAHVRGLHKRVRNGDLAAADELAGTLLFRLVRTLRSKYRQISDDWIWDSAADVVLEYLGDASKFEAIHAKHDVTLERFLTQQASRKIAHALRAEQRRKVRENEFFALFSNPVVELRPSAGILDNEVNDVLEELLADLTDRKILELYLAGERRTAEFAKVMRIAEMSLSEQRLEVKRAKDRILKIVRRKLEKNDR